MPLLSEAESEELAIAAFNAEVLQTVINVTGQADYLQKVRMRINSADDLIRPETEHDPTRRGQRQFKRAIREIMALLGPSVQ